MSYKINNNDHEKKVLDLVNLSPQMAREFNEIAVGSRKDFNDFVDDICLKNQDNPYIWAMPLVSRDIFIDDTFLKICRLRLFLKYIKDNRYDLVIVNSTDEKKCFEGIIDRYQKNVRIIVDDSRIEKAGNMFDHIASFLFFIKHELGIKMYSSNKGKRIHLQKTMVFSPVLSTGVSKGKYNDRYFTGIQNYSKCPLTFVPNIIMNGGLKRKRLVNALINDPEYTFVFPELFFSFTSIQKIFRYTMECRRLSKGKYFFQGIDISDIIKVSLMAGRSKWVAFDGIVHGEFIKQLSKIKTEITRFIVWFEGRPIDNMIVNAVKKYFPRAVCVAYISFPPDDNFISVHHTDYQIMTCQSPDVVTIPSAYYSRSFLSYEGKCRVSVVPIMRNRYILVNQKDTNRKFKKVLLLLSGLEDSNELIIRTVNEYTKGKQDVRILVKNHPIFIDKDISYFYKDKLNFDPEYAKGQISECLTDVDVAITSSTTSSVEVLFGRTPLIVLVPNGKLAYTGIPDEFSDLYKIAYGQEEFRSMIEYYLYENPRLDYEKLNMLFEEPTMESMAPLFE